MRNDSRPIFEHSPASPLGGPDETPGPHDRSDRHETVGADEQAIRGNEGQPQRDERTGTAERSNSKRS
jgi:hypothetical protein